MSLLTATLIRVTLETIQASTFIWSTYTPKLFLVNLPHPFLLKSSLKNCVSIVVICDRVISSANPFSLATFNLISFTYALSFYVIPQFWQETYFSNEHGFTTVGISDLDLGRMDLNSILFSVFIKSTFSPFSFTLYFTKLTFWNCLSIWSFLTQQSLNLHPRPPQKHIHGELISKDKYVKDF